VIAPGSRRERKHRLRCLRPDGLEDGQRLLDAVTGRKLVGKASSDEDHGHDLARWVVDGPSPALNPSGSNNNFDYSN
jgi:hypothetical protein